MKTTLCLVGAIGIAFLSGKPFAVAQEDAQAAGEAEKIPFEFAVMMADYGTKRNRALAEIDRIYLQKFTALKADYEQQNQETAVAAVRNKIVQLQKEIDRLEAAAGGGFVLLAARYGSEEKNVECLDLLLGQVRDDRLRITVKPAAVGLEADPHFGVRKTLTVKYLWNQEVRTASAQDGQLLVLPEEKE